MHDRKCHHTAYALYIRRLQKNIKSFNIAIHEMKNKIKIIKFQRGEIIHRNKNINQSKIN